MRISIPPDNGKIRTGLRQGEVFFFAHGGVTLERVSAQAWQFGDSAPRHYSSRVQPDMRARNHVR